MDRGDADLEAPARLPAGTDDADRESSGARWPPQILQAPDPPRVTWLWIGGLCSIACLVPIWAAQYLPMLDLAQHAAQVAGWVHRSDPVFVPPGVYRFNWLTPYIGAYLIARCLAVVASVPVAMKLTVTLAVVGLPLATLALLRAARGEPWWALASVPLAFGVSFYGGFLNYLIALPLAVLLVAAAVRLRREPTRGRALQLLTLSLALAACHAVAYGFGVVIALAALWGGSSDRRPAWRGPLPVLAPLPLVIAWALATWIAEPHVRTAISWATWAGRIPRMPATHLGSTAAVPALVALATIVAVLAVLGVRLRFARGLGSALAAASALFVLAPDGAFHTVLLPERLAAIVAVLVLSGARMPVRPLARRAVAALLVAGALAWSLRLAVQFRTFDREMRGFDDLLARMEPGRIVRVVPIDSTSTAVPGYPMFWHVGGWYQAEKGGLLGSSFAQLFPSLLRYRADPPWAEPLWGWRGQLNWRPEDAAFDYIVFRCVHGDPGSLLPRGPGAPVLLARSGEWWLYGRADRSASR